MKKDYVKKLCLSAVMAALYVALELLAMNISIAFLNNYQIPISCFPQVLTSVMLGPVWGTAVGIVGSFLSQIISYGLSWSTIVWMIPTICYSASVALLFLLFKKSYKPYILGIEFLLSSLLLSSLNLLARYVDINVLAVDYGFSFGTSELYDSLWGVFISLKLVGALVFAIIFAIIVPPIVKKLKKVIKI